MPVVADLLIKLGADSSGLSSELNKSQQEIQKTFSTNPVDEFSGSVDTVTGKVNSLLGTFTKFAGVAAAGFGLNAIIDSAVEAGEKIYQVQKRFNLTTAEAAQLSAVMKMTGGDVDTAAKSMMRLDKGLVNNTTEGKKAASVLRQMGLSLTDASGKLKPMNDQLAELAKGYRMANEAGQGQEFLMATLGVRGLTLAKTLLNYEDAAKRAAKIKGVGLDPEQMHEAHMQMQEVTLQFGKLGTVAGSALAPLVLEILPQVMAGLSETAQFISRNKDEITKTVVTITKLVAVYEALKLARRGASAIKMVVDNAQAKSVEAEQLTLTKTQERNINKAIADSDRMYAAMRREAIKTANQQKLSAQETQIYLAERFTQIGIAAAASAEEIRTSMTRAFLRTQVTAQESSVAISGAVAKSTAVSNEAAAAKIAANERVVLSNKGVAESEVQVGLAAKQAALLKETAVGAEILANERLITSNRGVGAAATLAGAETTKAVEQTTVATGVATEATNALGAAHTKAGVEGVLASQKSVGALSKLPSAIGTVTKGLFALAGGWLGVAAAALYAAYCAYQYFHAQYVEADRNTWQGEDGKYYTAHGGRIWQQTDNEQTNEDISADITGQGSIANGGKSERALQEGTPEYAAQYANWVAKGGGQDWEDAEQRRRDAEAAVSNPNVPDFDFSADGGGKHGREKEESYDIRGGAIYNAQRYSGLDYGTGENQVVCTTYIENAWSDAGVADAFKLGGWAPDWAQNAGSAFHATDAYGGGYEAHAGDAVITNNGDHVIMLDANASGYYAAAGSGRVSQHYDQDYREAFGGGIVGVISLTEFAGTNESGKALGAAELRKQAEQRAKDIANARKELSGLEAELDKTLVSDTGSEFEKDVLKLNTDAKKYEDTLRKIKNTSKDIDTSKAEDLLKQLKIEEAAKAMEALTARRLKFKTEVAQINAELTGDYKSVAEAEFNATVQSLDKQREARYREVAATKSDYEALAEANEWYTSSYLAAVQKREDADREAYEKAVQWAIQRGETEKLISLTQSQAAKDVQNWQARSHAAQAYYDIFQKANMSTVDMVASGSTQIASGIQSVFESLANGSESAKDSLRSLGKVFRKTITQMIAQMTANRIAMMLFGGLLGGGSAGSGFSFNSNLLGGSMFSSYTPSLGVSMPTFASGGLVTAPTIGLMAEAGNDEAVFPLTDAVFSRIGKGIAANSENTAGGSGAPVVNIINNSNGKVSLQSSNYDKTMRRWVLDIVVDAAETDEGGMTRAIRNAAKG